MRKVQDLAVATVSYLRNGRGSGFGSGSSQLGLANSLNAPKLHSGLMPQEMQKNMKICAEGVPGYKSMNIYIYIYTYILTNQLISWSHIYIYIHTLEMRGITGKVTVK